MPTQGQTSIIPVETLIAGLHRGPAQTSPPALRMQGLQTCSRRSKVFRFVEWNLCQSCMRQEINTDGQTLSQSAEKAGPGQFKEQQYRRARKTIEAAEAEITKNNLHEFFGKSSSCYKHACQFLDTGSCYFLNESRKVCRVSPPFPDPHMDQRPSAIPAAGPYQDSHPRALQRLGHWERSCKESCS